MIAPSRRTLIVFSSLIASITVASSLLLMLEPATNGSKLDTLSNSASVPNEPDLTLDHYEDHANLVKNFIKPIGKEQGWKKILILSSGRSQGNSQTLKLRHRLHGLTDLNYHFVLGNGRGAPDGKIEISPRWQRQEASMSIIKEEIKKVVGTVTICLIGDLDRELPTDGQIKELVVLVNQLQKKYRIPREHVQVVGESCRLFPTSTFRQQLASS